MTKNLTSTTTVRIPKRPEDLGNTALLGICTSMKPAPGKQSRSATRGILSYVLNTVGSVSPNVFLLDLRDYPIPLFDGRMPDEVDAPSVKFTKSCIERSATLLLSVPAYWSGVSGVFKNFIDTLCGPIYDMEGTPTTVFTNKPVGLFIVGADDISTRAGAEQAKQIMLSVGAKLVREPIAISNPRLGDVDAKALLSELIVITAELAKDAYLSKRGEV
jgi:NAD(P)H-dependent FMN reductase